MITAPAAAMATAMAIAVAMTTATHLKIQLRIKTNHQCLPFLYSLCVFSLASCQLVNPRLNVLHFVYVQGQPGEMILKKPNYAEKKKLEKMGIPII